MLIVLHPAVEPERLAKIRAAAAPAKAVNAASEQEALAAMGEADGFFGKITPRLLTAAKKLR